MIFEDVKKCKILSEFSAEEQEQHFGLIGKKTLHHIDSFYYTVSLREYEYIDGWAEVDNFGIINLLNDLAELKERKKLNRAEDVQFCGLSVEIYTGGKGTYKYALSMPELFDIFIAESLPNKFTPRIFVQLRTRTLILNGVRESVEMTLDVLRAILARYDLEIESVQENRIDYAYHTNTIQKPESYLNDNYLCKHLKSKLKMITKVGRLPRADEDFIDYNYMALGVRGNAIYFRVYDKVREVVEQNYKSFFIERWKANKLISAYDYYVLMHAFKQKSFVTGILAGRIEWYLEHGKNKATLEELRELKKTCYIESDNTEFIRQRLDGLLPRITTILNFEYETLKKFYNSIEKMISVSAPVQKSGYLGRIYAVLSLHSPICDYLTTETVSFVNDNKAVKNDRKKLDFWKRLSSTKISDSEDGEIIREYANNNDIKLIKNKLVASVATLSLYLKKDYESCDINADLSEAITLINDNDIQRNRQLRILDEETGELVELQHKDYRQIKRRKGRRIRGVLGDDNKI